MNNETKEKFMILLSQMHEDQNMFLWYISSLLFKEDDDISQINKKIEQSIVLSEFLKEQTENKELIKLVDDNLSMLVQRISS